MKIKLDLKSVQLEVTRSGYSVNELAERAGLTRSTISRVLNNQVAVRPSTAGKIAKALEVEVESLLFKKIEREGGKFI